jgi:triosephosphate isomerase
MRARRPFVAGNWKMNTTLKSATELAAGLAKLMPQDIAGVEVAVCPPATYLIPVGAAIAGSGVKLGAQNCNSKDSGAFTGEIALDMLQDVGCQYVILGHSERRALFGETDAVVNAKVKAALAKGINVILCVGEQLAERQGNQTEAVLEGQMSGSLANVNGDQFGNLVLAYEPVWAIGTGLTASPEQAESAHVFLRQWVASRYNPQIAETLRILYGGSVKGDNAKTLLSQPNVDGALVGGASLKVDQFWPIVAAGIEVGNS